MATSLLELLAHVMSDPNRLKTASALSQAWKTWQASSPRWEAAGAAASAHLREHPGTPLPSEVAGAVAEALAVAETLERLLIETFGEKMPEEVREGFEGARAKANEMRALLRPSQN